MEAHSHNRRPLMRQGQPRRSDRSPRPLPLCSPPPACVPVASASIVDDAAGGAAAASVAATTTPTSSACVPKKKAAKAAVGPNAVKGKIAKKGPESPAMMEPLRIDNYERYSDIVDDLHDSIFSRIAECSHQLKVTPMDTSRDENHLAALARLEQGLQAATRLKSYLRQRKPKQPPAVPGPQLPQPQ
eukprot:GHVU01207588.1.p1 GENE.GHVU01207588.1~~GHVU01207588.1.p1  ORF type:complete len:187 (+),score=21.97 GHVU01207588.1:410-970(+)